MSKEYFLLPITFKQEYSAIHISSSLKGVTHKPYLANKKPTQTYRHRNTYGNKPFLWQCHQRNTQRKKKPWQEKREKMVDLLNEIKNTVREYERHIPVIISYLQSLSRNFRAGRVAHHFSAWIKITRDKEILTHITGVS